MRRTCLLGLIGVLVAPSVFARPGGKVAVLDVRLSRVNPALAPILNELLASEVQASGQFDNVVSGSDLRTLIDFEAQKQMLGCEGDACLAEIGGALGVDRLIATNIGKVGGALVVNVKVIDIVDPGTERRAYRTVRGEDALIDALRGCVAEVLPRPVSASSGPRLTSYLLWGAGAVGLALGVGFGLDARSRLDKSAPELPGSQTESAAGQSSQRVANIGFGVAAIGALTGLAAWWLAPSPGRPVITPVAGRAGAGLGLVGTF